MDTKGAVLRRIESVDVFRLIAITLVILVHTQQARGFYSKYGDVYDIGLFIDQLSRFAVPFFFIISGYFWGTKVKNSLSIAPISIPMAKRIFIIFIAWSIIYATPYNITSIVEYGPLGPLKVDYWNLANLMRNPITLMLQGTSGPLWFLIALICSLGISSLLVKKKHYKTLIALSVALYVIGLLTKAYSCTSFGIKIAFDTRFGPFVGTIFFVTGYFLSKLTPTREWLLKGIALFGVGCIIHFSEIYLLHRFYGVHPYLIEYSIGCYFMGVGAAVVSIADFAPLRSAFLSHVGKFTLGIYAIHMVFVDLLRPFFKITSSWFWELGYIALVLLFSITSVMFLSKNQLTRRFVI